MKNKISLFLFVFLLNGVFAETSHAATYVPWNPSYALWYPVVESPPRVALNSSVPRALPFTAPQITPAVTPMFVATPAVTQSNLLVEEPYFATSQPVASQDLFVQVDNGNTFPLTGVSVSALPEKAIAVKSPADAVVLGNWPKAMEAQDREALTLALRGALKDFPAGQYSLRFFYK